MQSPPCFFICFILLLTGTSRADSDVSFTFKRAEDILSDFDSASGAPSLEDETNLENPFISDSSSFSPLGSNLFTNSDLDNSLISTSIGPNMPIGNDEPSVDLFADTSEKCSLDPNSKVNRRGEACLPAIGNPASLIENFQSQPGVLTPEAIDEAIRTTPYGLVLTSESDYAWCDPQFQRKYAICDSGFSFDRIPLPTPPLYDLYDCTSYFTSKPCTYPKKVWCCEYFWFSVNDLKWDSPDVATNCLQLLDPASFEIPTGLKPF